MDLKTITTTLALLGATTGCGGEAKKEEVKTETKTEVKTEVKTVDVKEVAPVAGAKADDKAEMKCGEGKCGEGKCGGDKAGDGKAIPVDAAKTGDAKAGEIKAPEKPTDKPADKT